MVQIVPIQALPLPGYSELCLLSHTSPAQVPWVDFFVLILPPPGASPEVKAPSPGRCVDSATGTGVLPIPLWSLLWV